MGCISSALAVMMAFVEVISLVKSSRLGYVGENEFVII
jgi:hypothetical protein